MKKMTEAKIKTEIIAREDSKVEAEEKGLEIGANELLFLVRALKKALINLLLIKFIDREFL